jgi:hypothetical protein
MGFPFRGRVEHEPSGDVAVVQMKDLDDANLLHLEDAIRVALPAAKAHHLLRPGDLLFRSRGRTNGAARVMEGIGKAVLAAPMLLVRPRRILPEYLCWFLNAPATRQQFAAMAEGTSVRMISAEALKALPVPLPPIDLQQRIASISELIEREQTLLHAIARRRHRLNHHLLETLAREATP